MRESGDYPGKTGVRTVYEQEPVRGLAQVCQPWQRERRGYVDRLSTPFPGLIPCHDAENVTYPHCPHHYGNDGNSLSLIDTYVLKIYVVVGKGPRYSGIT